MLWPFPNRQSNSIAIGKAIGYRRAISSITTLGGREGGGREEDEGRKEDGGRREGGGKKQEGRKKDKETEEETEKERSRKGG